MNTEKILRNDSIISNIVVSRKMVYNNIHQCKMEQETITKYVYKTHNEVFNVNRMISEAPKCKCVFTCIQIKKVATFKYMTVIIKKYL